MIKYKKINQDVLGLLPNVGKVLEADSDIIFAYCFGSYGKGRPHSLSDVDIAVFLNFEVEDTFEKKLQLQEKLSNLLLTDEIDIVILNDAAVSLAIEVLRTGKLLVSKDEEKRINFETKIIKRYLDTLWLREFSERSLIRRIKEGRYGYSQLS